MRMSPARRFCAVLLFGMLGACGGPLDEEDERASAVAVAGAAPLHLFSPPQAQTDSEILLLWDSPANLHQLAFAGYVIFQDGANVGQTTKLGFTASGLSPHSSHVFTVRTKTRDGSLSPASNPLTVSTRPSGQVLDVRSFGAVGDGSTLNTAAIQKAIDSCPSGGTVLIPAGTFKSGAL